MKKRIMKIAYKNKTVASVCVITVLLVVLGFVSVSTAKPTEENPGQPENESPRQEENSGHPAETDQNIYGEQDSPDLQECADERLLTDEGVSVEVSNYLVELEKDRLCGYPYWIGNLEKLEDGVRYVYELRLDKDDEQIVYTKSVYDTKKVVEQIRIDMNTGEEVPMCEVIMK